MSYVEDIFEIQIIEERLPEYKREFRFDKKRRWRFDFAWEEFKVAVEIDGGIYAGGRHVRGEGFEKDLEKMNAAVGAGWRVFRFTPRQVKRYVAIEYVKGFLRNAS